MGRCYQSLARSVADAVGAEDCHIALYDDETDELVACRPRYAAQGKPVPQFRFPLDEAPASAHVVRTGRMHVTNAPGEDPLYDPSVLKHGVRSILTMPVRHDGRIRGLLYALNKPGGFGDDDVATVASLADAAGVTLANIHLYSDERERRLLNESLREVSRALVDLPSEDDALGILLDQMWRVVRYQAAAALAPDDDALRLAASRGGAPGREGTRVAAEALSGVMKARTVARVPEAAARLPELGLPPGTALAAPLVAKGHVLGVLVVAFGNDHVPSLREGEIVAMFAEHAARFLDAGAVLRRERQARARASAVARLTRLAVTLREPQALLAAAAPEFLSLSGADRVVLYLRHPANLVLIPSADAGLTDLEALDVRDLRFDFSSGPLSLLADSRTALTFGAGSDHPPQRFTSLKDVRSLAAIPLWSRDEVVGAVFLGWIGREQRFEPATVEFLYDVAQQLALGMENARLMARFAQLAATDELTRLANRRRFSESFLAEISRARRANGNFGVVLLDVDHLKKINDTHGHQAGDNAIRHVADALRRGARVTDCAARLGGEEFAVLLAGADLAGAALKAERIRLELEETGVEPVGAVTVSVGVAVYPQDGETEAALVKVADARMYTAKQAGRNRVCYRDAEE